MLRACYPSAGLSGTGGFPPIRVSWRQHRIDRRQLALFLRLTGLHADQALPMLYPQVFGFPLLMVILTHPAFPIPIWNSLQIRNHLLHTAIARRRARPGDACRQRILEKGAEVDLYTSIRARMNWFGRASTPSITVAATANRVRPRPWLGTGGGTRCSPVAYGGRRRLALRRPQRNTAAFTGRLVCAAVRLSQGFSPSPARARPVPGASAAPHRRGQRLDAWLKGPVYYDSEVSLQGTVESDGMRFALSAADEQRPAIIGCFGNVASENRICVD